MTPSLPRPSRRARTALAALPLVIVLGACADDTTPAGGRADDAQSSPSDAPSSQSSSESPTEEPGAGESPGVSGAVPVYFVADAPGGLRLFREFQPGNGSDPLTQAAMTVDGGSPVDGDYRTLWPGNTIAGVEATTDALVVTLEGDAFTEAPDGMTRRQARLALQQLVYSLQGAAQERLPVQFLRPSGETRLFGLDVSAPVVRASALEVLNLVSITSPAEGATVPRGPVEVTGVANSFEASGPCELSRDGEALETIPYMTDGWMEDKLFPFVVTFAEVEPGDYLLTCRTDDPSGGAEGNGPMSDTKRFTVQ